MMNKGGGYMQANFASVYAFLNDELFYQEWFNFLAPKLCTPKQILDLGCGNGTLLKLLHDAGHQVTGVDYSSEMLQLAAEKLGNHAALYEFDMSDFCTKTAQYDIILSTCDSLNYLPNVNKLEQVFANVSMMLKEGGFFIFDVHSDYTFNERFANWSYGDASDALSVIWNIDTSDGFLYEHFLTFFLQQENGTYARFDEVQQEYFYPHAEICTLLQQYFTKITYTSDFTNSYDSLFGERTFFVVER